MLKDSSVSNVAEKPPAVTKINKKPTRVEKWEIDAIGRFLLPLYHSRVIASHKSWLVLKQKMRDEFEKFLCLEENCDLRAKFTEVNGKCEIGSLLFRTKYLKNTKRGSEFYCIKHLNLFQYRNEKLSEYDEQQKNGSTEFVLESNSASTTVVVQNLEKTRLDPAFSDVLKVDENAILHSLSYEGSQIQSRDTDFLLTSMGCYICQRNFLSADELEDHVEEHGDESDFELKRELTKLESPTFKLSYSICENSHYFCFFMDFERPDIIVDKIIVVQTRSFYYVNNDLPYTLPEKGQEKFFVDSHLFRICVEQPIIIVFHDKFNCDIRTIEQHHFVRIEEFPKVNLSISPNRLPSKLLFKKKFKLPNFLPPANVHAALKVDVFEDKLCEMSNEFKDYLRNGKTITQQNLKEVMRILLQVEDVDTMREYNNLIQRNVKLRKFCNEYMLKLKIPKKVTIENVISLFDEVIILQEDTVTSPQSLDTLIDQIDRLREKGQKEKKQKIFYGQVDRVSNGRVTFVCDKKLGDDIFYTILFRPTRLPLRYQYRALEQLVGLKRTIVARYLFPHNIPCTLSNPKMYLELRNKSIYNNPEQLEAVCNVLNNAAQLAPYIIFGPPGTGKTTTIVEAILQVYELQPKSRILIMAGSNSACDEVALRLCKILSTLDQPRTIARIYSRSNEKRSDNIDELLLEYSNMYNAQFYPHVDVLHQYRIVVCTLSVVGTLATGMFGKNSTGGSIFTHIFIDEVAASTEAETLVGVLNTVGENTSLIISGDHKQLGPILNSSRAAELGLSVSLMERLLARNCYCVDEDGKYNRNIQTRLCRNFRSHPEIVQLYNRLYYDNELKAVTTDDVNSLCRDWHRSPNPDYPIIFHSVYGSSQRDGRSTSWYNPLEIAIVMDYVKDLMYFGVNGRKIEQSDIGIISPYKKQYLRIQEELNLRHWYQIETGAVETFQGKEKAIIIVSFVRSFSSSLGFLENPRRLNVTLSRAKSLLILIGNPQTLSKNNDLKYVIDQCREHKTMLGSYYNELADGISTVETLTCRGNKKCNGVAEVKKLTKSMEKLNIGKGNDAAGQPKKPKKKIAVNKCNITSTDNESHINKNANTFKHVNSASNEKQRKTFNMYKDVYETKELNENRNAAKKTAIDELFDELPRVPGPNQRPSETTTQHLHSAPIGTQSTTQRTSTIAPRTTAIDYLTSVACPSATQRNAYVTQGPTGNRIPLIASRSGQNSTYPSTHSIRNMQQNAANYSTAQHKTSKLSKKSSSKCIIA